MTPDPQDLAFMRRAIALARTRVGLTDPNPAVGCVLVAEGQVVGEAATAPGGAPTPRNRLWIRPALGPVARPPT